MISNNNNVPFFEGQTVLNNVAPLGSYDFPTICGIDSLYYFVKSNRDYEVFYCDIGIAINDIKDDFKGYVPADSYFITLADKEFVYYGNKEGFFFFGDKAGWLRLGFKDPYKNKGVQDIRVQLQAAGIYLLGLKPLLDYVNNTLLRSISIASYTVTRADLNIFCQYDLSSVVNKEHIATRKQKFVQLFGSKKGYETMYVGKPPFRLRLYDKATELRGSDKSELMYSYFIENGFNPTKDLWNLEFECHRDFLKRYKISTVDDLLKRAETLFHRFMKLIRLCDISTISQKDFDGGRLHRAETHPLWAYIDSSYKYSGYQQSSQPLERLLPKVKEYTTADFLNEFRALVYKASENLVLINNKDITQILHDSSVWLSHEAKKTVKPFIPIIFETGEAQYFLTRNFIPVPILPADLSRMYEGDMDLAYEALTKSLHQEISENNPNTTLITKHMAMIEKERHRRRQEKRGQQELNYGIY